MSGSDSKRGEWYEEGAVVLHLLDVLAGWVRWVRWEALVDGDGVDFSIGAADGSEMHVQAKHRSNQNFKWTWGKLRSDGILPYAQEVLQKPGKHSYRLLTDQPAPDLKSVAYLARTIDQPAVWKTKIESHWDDIVRDFCLDPSQPQSVQQAHTWFSLITCEIASSFIDERVDAMAQVLAGDRGTDLVLRIKKAAQERIRAGRSDLTWNADDLREVATQAGIHLLPVASDPPWERLRALTDEFISDIHQDRFLVAGIPRPEVDQIIDHALAIVPGGTVVVHAAAGEGKSEVLAAVAEQLVAKRMTVLSLSLTRIDTVDAWLELRLGPEPLDTLARSCGTNQAFLVLDQLDALVWAGGSTAPLLRRVKMFLRRARKLGITAIVGCRSIDREDGRLKIILAPEPTTEQLQPRPEVEVEIPRLSISQTESALLANNIVPGTLTNEVLTLARRPLWLRFIVRLPRINSQMERVRTHLDLVRRFWEWSWDELRRSGLYSAATTVLHQLTANMEQAGTMRVACTRIGPEHKPVIDRLRSLGILSVEPRYLQFSHQTLVDYLLAERWSEEVIDGTDLIRRIGSRNQQDLATSNRLRLLLPLLLHDRTDLLPTIRDLVATEGLRPLVRLGIYQALAAVDQSEDLDRAGPIVLHWLDQPDRRWRILAEVVYGRAEWVTWLANHDHALHSEQNWLDRACRTAPNTSERFPIWRVLGSTGPQDPVADRLLQGWADQDPGLLQEADLLFLHEPQVLSDKRFELYLRKVKLSPPGCNYQLKWPEFMAATPERATQLLAIILGHEKDLRLREQALHGLPRRHPNASRAGIEFVQNLLPWWCRQDISVPASIWLNGTLREQDSLWFVICDLLAHVAAQALVTGQLTWSILLDWLPTSLRYQDKVLLLRIGVSLADVHPYPHPATCMAAAEWFRVNPEVWGTTDGTGHPDRWQLPGRFLVEVVNGLEVDQVRHLAVTIADQPEPCMPQIADWEGITSFRLLSVLPVACRPNRIAIAWNSLEAKFQSTTRAGASDRSWSRRKDKSERSPEEWRGHLRTAAQGSGASLDEVLAEFFSQIKLDPLRFFILAQTLTSDDPSEARRLILEGLLRNGPFPSCSLEEAEFLILRSASDVRGRRHRPYLDEPACHSAIAIVVRDHCRHLWSDPVIAALTSWVMIGTDPEPSFDNDGEYPLAQVTHLPLLALTALTQVAWNQPTRKPQVWQLVLQMSRRMTAQRNPVWAGCLIEAAFAVREDDSIAVDSLIADWCIDPQVSAQGRINGNLVVLVRGDDVVPDAQRRICNSLFGLAWDHRSWIQRIGGETLVKLRHIQRIDDSVLPRLVAAPLTVRRGAIHILTDALRLPSPPAWAKEWFLRLAEAEAQEPDQIRDLARLFDKPTADHLLDDSVFLRRLTTSGVMARDPHSFVEACDRRAHLRPMAYLITKIATDWTSADKVGFGFSGRDLLGLVIRLAEEARNHDDVEIVPLALDAWDALIEYGDPDAARALARQWE